MICQTGQRGRNEGEFLGIRLIRVFDQWIYTTDQIKPGIQVFDTCLIYHYHIPFTTPIHDFHILSPDQILILPFDLRQSGFVQLINQKGMIIQKIIYTNDRRDSIGNLASFTVSQDSIIYIAFKFQDRIMAINLKGDVLWDKSYLNTIDVDTKNILGFKLPKKIIFLDIARDVRGYLYLLVGDVLHYRKREIIILSKSGQKLSELSLHASTHCIHISEENHLYSRSARGTVINKYRIDYE
jgi:hypothetical protein